MIEVSTPQAAIMKKGCSCKVSGILLHKKLILCNANVRNGFNLAHQLLGEATAEITHYEMMVYESPQLPVGFSSACAEFRRAAVWKGMPTAIASRRQRLGKHSMHGQ